MLIFKFPRFATK